MANYQSLKAAINAVIKANGNKEITGTVLNEVLLAMVNSLGAGYQFAGVATPSTNPGTPDQKVFYIASQAGTYTNFGGAVVSDGIAIFEWNGTWTTETLDLSMAGQVQSDWTETDTTKKSYIKHKPNIPPSANVDTVPTEDSPNAVSSGGTYDMIVNTAATLFGDIQDATNVNAIESVDGKIYNDYQAGDIFFIVDNNVRKYRVALAAGTADVEHPVTISPVNFYYALNSADAINLSLTLKTVSTEQQSLSSKQKAQARTNIAAVSYDQQSLSADQQVQAQNNMMGKVYDAATFSGLGKKVLAKNIQTVGGVQKNVMTQAFFQDGQGNDLENTIFVIEYDYDLAGATITIPANCTLYFDGGSVKNGSIVFDNTLLTGDIKIGCHISGTVTNDSVSTTFFLESRIENDAVDAINELLSICNLSSKPLYISKGTYIIDKFKSDDIVFELFDNARIYGDGIDKTVFKIAPALAAANRYVKLFFKNIINNVHIEGITFDVNGRGNPGNLSNVDTYRFLLLAHYGNNIVVDSCKVYDNNGRQSICLGENVAAKQVSNVQIRNCVFDTLGNESAGGLNQTDHSAIYINGTDVKIYSNTFVNPTTIVDGVINVCAAMEIHCDNVFLSNNYVKNFKAAVNVVATVSSHVNALYQNNIFENVYMGFDVWVFGNSVMNNVNISNNIIRKASHERSAISIENLTGNIDGISITNNDISCTEAKPSIEKHYRPAIYVNECRAIDLSIEGNNIHDYHSGAIHIKAHEREEYDINVIITNNTFKNIGLLQNVGAEYNNIAITAYDLVGKTFVVDNNKCIECPSHVIFMKLYQDYFDNMRLTNNLTTDLIFIATSIISSKGVLANTLQCYNNSSYPDINESLAANNGAIFDIIGSTLKFKRSLDGTFPASAKSIYNNSTYPNTTNERGDLVFYTDVAKNGCVGLACITRGNPGTWKPFGKIEPSDVFAGVTANRPLLESNNDEGFQYFDTTLGKPIWWSGSAWVDATGATV